MNPFVVTHNGEKYVFTPGETVEVSDGVALEIEEYKRWREKYYGTIDPPYEGGGDIEELIVTVNGTYTPPEGVDGYAPVTVNVAPPASDIDALIDGSLTEITSNAESVHDYKFFEHSKLITANFPQATSIGDLAFRSCNQLITVNIPNATKIGAHVFRTCAILTTVNSPKVTSLGQYAFEGCMQLTTANFPELTKLLGNSTFQHCSALITVNLPKVTSLTGYTFSYCTKLKTANFPEATIVDYGGFEKCYVLTTANFHKVTSLNSYAFHSCYSLKAVMLRGETLCTLANQDAFNNCYHLHGTVNATYNPNGLKDGYIYVPRALIEDYKVATNWTTFATQFRALEDYTVDGTTTGELDESKVSL
jgi:hypothetical protein